MKLLAKKERAQIERAISLCDRIRERQGVGDADEYDDEIAGPAMCASAQLSELLDNDSAVRRRMAAEDDRARFDAWLHSGAWAEDLRRAKARGES